MFDLALLASPARLKREFLATTEVAPQDMPPELAWEFAQLKEERPDVRMSGAFWLGLCKSLSASLMALVAG